MFERDSNSIDDRMLDGFEREYQEHETACYSSLSNKISKRHFTIVSIQSNDKSSDILWLNGFGRPLPPDVAELPETWLVLNQQSQRSCCPGAVF